MAASPCQESSLEHWELALHLLKTFVTAGSVCFHVNLSVNFVDPNQFLLPHILLDSLGGLL